MQGLPDWSGELRSGARANVLMGVASNRVDVHQAAAAGERALERRAEPLSALFLPHDAYPHSLLGIGWRNLVLNSAHDSSCACSNDDVVEAVRVRYQEARHVGDALAGAALTAFAKEIDAPARSAVIVNASAVDRAGVIEMTIPSSGPAHVVALDDGTAWPTQVVATRAAQGLSTVVTGQKIRWVLEMMRGPEFAGARIGRVEQRRRDDGVVEVALHETAPGETPIDLESTREALLGLGDAGETIAVRQLRAPLQDIVFAVGAMPSFGWRTFGIAEGAGPPTGVSAGGTVLANEHVRVEVDPSDGSLTIDADGVHVSGANRLVDGGDGGDTYNYSPPDSDTIVDRPEAVTTEVVEAGPVRARLAVTAAYRLPTHAVGDERSCARRSEDAVLVDIRTLLELRTGERFLRIHVELDNRVRDHRLRAHFPLPVAVDGSDAECAFAVVHRGLTAEGGPHERGLPTFVSRRFVDATDGDLGLALLHDGLLEYEVVGDGNELALTLFRATGYLSRSELAFRPNPAGPLDPLEGPELQRRLAFDYAVRPHRGDWRTAASPTRRTRSSFRSSARSAVASPVRTDPRPGVCSRSRARRCRRCSAIRTAECSPSGCSTRRRSGRRRASPCAAPRHADRSSTSPAVSSATSPPPSPSAPARSSRSDSPSQRPPRDAVSDEESDHIPMWSPRPVRPSARS